MKWSGSSWTEVNYADDSKIRKRRCMNSAARIRAFRWKTQSFREGNGPMTLKWTIATAAKKDLIWQWGNTTVVIVVKYFATSVQRGRQPWATVVSPFESASRATRNLTTPVPVNLKTDGDPLKSCRGNNNTTHLHFVSCEFCIQLLFQGPNVGETSEEEIQVILCCCFLNDCTGEQLQLILYWF